jgi:hypothetical protein
VLFRSIRGFRTPIRLTRRMADFFPQAPAHLTVEQALRWCQVRGLGGDERFAAAVAVSGLGTDFVHEAYWSRVLRFLIGWRNLESELIAPLLEFLRRHPAGFPNAGSRSTSIIYRSLRVDVRKWMAKEGVGGPLPRRTWSPTPIRGLEYLEPRKHEGSVRSWTIRELTDSRELSEEGKDLHHCVAGYVGACASHATSIWSMRSHGLHTSQRVLTIEVKPARRLIVQARGKCNARPQSEARAVMKMWAQANGLAIASSM